MKKTSRSQFFILAACFLLALLVFLAPWPALHLSRGVREFRIHARQYAYAPALLRARQGERITIALESDDVTHGLYLDSYGVDLVAVPGRAARATFVADRPGKYRLRCSKVCGTLHPFMLGELVVTPNAPFWRAAALALLVGLGTVSFLLAGRRPENITR